jgi:phospholipid/cholesterol/gamma-HCH transport system substrate-binding protein
MSERSGPGDGLPERRERPGGGRPEQLERRAGWLLLALLLLVVGSVLYVLYARGVFEATQRVVLLADDSEGVSVGMDLTFSGFAIGRVSRIDLAGDGVVRMTIDVPRRDAKWLRSSSVFTLTRGLVGNTSLRVYSGRLEDPPLPDGAERRVLAGDASSEVPKLLAQMRDLMANLAAMTAADSPLAATLGHAQTVSERMAGRQGALEAVFGNPDDARKLLVTLDRTNQLLARMDALAARTDGLVQRSDQVLAQAGEQVFGPDGLTRDVQQNLRQLHGLLGDARGTLKRVDAVLREAETTARHLSGASEDLGRLRADIDASLRRVDGLILDVQRRWPFERDTAVKLP